MMPECCVT